MEPEQTGIKPPDKTYMLDFVGIGFKGGVETTLEVIRALYPELTIDVDVAELRAQWAERQGGEGELLKMEGRSMMVTHAWAFRLMAVTFLDYMEQIGAENFVRQEMNIRPAMPSGVEEIMVEVSRMNWWKKNRQGKTE